MSSVSVSPEHTQRATHTMAPAHVILSPKEHTCYRLTSSRKFTHGPSLPDLRVWLSGGGVLQGGSKGTQSAGQQSSPSGSLRRKRNLDRKGHFRLLTERKDPEDKRVGEEEGIRPAGAWTLVFYVPEW